MLFNLLQSIDIFYLMPKISFSGKEKFQSNIGGLFTIILLFAVVITSLSFLENLINHENSNSTSSEKYINEYPLINFSSRPQDVPFLAFSMNFVGNIDINFFENEGMSKYFDIEYSESRFEKIEYLDNKTNKTVTMYKEQKVRTIPTEKCSSDAIRAFMKNDEYVNDFLKFTDVTKYICPKYSQLDSNLSVRGTWGDDNFTILSYKLNICKNITGSPSKSCASEEEIRNIMNELIIHLLIKTPIIDLSNYGAPIKNVFTPMETSFINKKTKVVEIYLAKGFLYSDDGILLDRVRKEELVLVDETKEIIKEGIYDLLILFRAKNKQVVFSRKYDKATEIVAKVGGMLNALFLSVGFVMGFINRKLYKLELVKGVLEAEAKVQRKHNFEIPTSKVEEPRKSPTHRFFNGIKSSETFLIMFGCGKTSSVFEEKYEKIYKTLNLFRIYKFSLDLKRIKVKIKALESVLKQSSLQNKPTFSEETVAKYPHHQKSDDTQIPSEKIPADGNKNLRVWTWTPVPKY